MVATASTRTAPYVRYASPIEAPVGSLLGQIDFTSADACTPTGLNVRVALDSLNAAPLCEQWSAIGPVRIAREGGIEYACDEHFLMGAVEIAEPAAGGIEHAAAQAYRLIRQFTQRSPFSHVIRMWNYLDNINQGDGDDERYRRFCAGRALGFGNVPTETLPAASALGRQRTTGALQVYWLAGRIPGVPLENPRQVSAYRYPPQYGPVAPSFARAMLLPNGPLMISGTASIVGHDSQHVGNVQAQLHETLTNLEALIAQAMPLAPQLPAQLGASSLLKIYLRDAAHAREVEATLRARFGARLPMILLAADICRRELLVEIDCLHGIGVPAG